MSPIKVLRTIPWVLIAFRLSLGVGFPLLAYFHAASPVLLVTLLWLGVLSDIFDGIIARKLGSATSMLRRMDSQTDLVFFVGVLIACVLLHGTLLKAHTLPIGVLCVLEAVCYAISFAKFGREPCTHCLAAKLFGLSLLLALTAVLGWGIAGIPFWTMFGLGLLADIECISILLLLRGWDRDIPTSYHAWCIRQGRPIKRHALFN